MLHARQYVRPAGQALPSGLPTGTVQQAGSSVTPAFMVVLVGSVLAAGALAVVLTRTAPEQLEPAPVRITKQSRRTRRSSGRRRSY